VLLCLSTGSDRFPDTLIPEEKIWSDLDFLMQVCCWLGQF
jgi:hypothetical protein